MVRMVRMVVTMGMELDMIVVVIVLSMDCLMLYGLNNVLLIQLDKLLANQQENQNITTTTTKTTTTITLTQINTISAN